MSQNTGALERLSNAARLLGGVKRGADYYEMIFDEVETVFGCKHAAVLLKDKDADILTVVASRGDGSDIVPGQRIHTGQDVKGRAMSSGTTQLVTSTISAGSASTDGEGDNCEVVAPLFGTDRNVIGILTVKGESGRCMETSLPIFSLFGEQVSTLLQQTKLRKELDERSRRLVTAAKAVQLSASDTPLASALERICELATDAMKPDGCSLQLCSEDRSHLVVEAACGYEQDVSGMQVPKDCGVSGVAMATRRPTLTPNMADSQAPDHTPVAPDFLSELAVPLVYRDTVLGVLHLGHRKAGAFDETDLLVATILADSAAARVGTHRAVSDAADDAIFKSDYFSLMQTVAASVSRTTDADDLFSEVLASAAAFLRFQRAAVLVPSDDGTHLKTRYLFGYDGDKGEAEVSLPSTLPGEAYRTAETVFTSESEKERVSLVGDRPLPVQIATPLKSYGELVGVLFVESEIPFLPAEIRSLETLCAPLSLAIRAVSR